MATDVRARWRRQSASCPSGLPRGRWHNSSPCDILAPRRNTSSWISTVLLEFADGFLELLPMPTTRHQRISALPLSRRWTHSVTARKLGEILVAPLKVRIRKGKYREPDVRLHEVRACRAHQQ